MHIVKEHEKSEQDAYMACFIWMHGYLDMSITKQWQNCNYATHGKCQNTQTRKKYARAGLQQPAAARTWPE